MNSDVLNDLIFDCVNGETYYVDVDVREALLDILGANKNDDVTLPFENEDDAVRFLQNFALSVHNIPAVEKARKRLKAQVTHEMRSAMKKWISKNPK